MGYDKLIIWILEIVAAWVVIFGLQIPLRRSYHPIIRTIVFIIKVLMIPAAALCFVAIEEPMAYVHGDKLTAIYIALAGDIAASVIEYLIRRIGYIRREKSERPACKFVLLGFLSLLLCFGVLIYGIWDSGTIVKEKHVWKAEGLSQPHTFAFVSDLHAGSTQSAGTLREMCRQINDEEVEFLILGGDITDELSTYEDMEDVYSIFWDLDMPIYFIYGNHDRQERAGSLGERTYEDQDLAKAMKRYGIKPLADEYLQVADDLVLLGREDLSSKNRKPWSELKNPYEGQGALIVADHQPLDRKQLSAEESVLQISGHTHAGQLWPLQLVYNAMDIPAYGEYRQPKSLLYVSAGAGNWMIPLRTEERCQWDLITLEP